jgi:hypothetical protein
MPYSRKRSRKSRKSGGISISIKQPLVRTRIGGFLPFDSRTHLKLYFPDPNDNWRVRRCRYLRQYYKNNPQETPSEAKSIALEECDNELYSLALQQMQQKFLTGGRKTRKTRKGKKGKRRRTKRR